MQKNKWTVAACLTLSVILTIISCKTQFAVTKENYSAVKSTPAFERGKVLAFSICAGCHYDRKVNKFIGTAIHDIPGIAGKVYSANLTQSKTNGIAPRYTDAELKYLLKTGIARDGRFLEYMLRPNMADADINAIIAYLRSDDPAVAAADTTIGLTHFTFIGKAYMNMHAKPAPYTTGITVPTDPAKLGYYLVDNLGCFHCHSASLNKLDLLHPDQTKGYLAGGMKMKSPGGGDIRVANITPDNETGIGKYTREQLRKALMEGQAPNGELQPPMPKFSKLTVNEVDAIYAYLQTVAPVHNVVKSM